VGIYIHASIKFVIKDKSSNHSVIDNANIDYVLLELVNSPKVALVCMYCPPGSKSDDIIAVLSHIKSQVKQSVPLIVGGDFNINLLHNKVGSIDLLDSLHTQFASCNQLTN
jgi:exonuclease III